MPRQIRFEHPTPASQTGRIVQGDLTEEPADAIVNAANKHPTHGGGREHLDADGRYSAGRSRRRPARCELLLA